MKSSDDYMDQKPVTDAYADLEAFQEAEQTARADQVEQAEYTPPEQVELPDTEIKSQTQQLEQGTLESFDENLLETQISSVEDELEFLKLSPEARYRKVLERNDITINEARKIIDCVIVQLEPYEERVPLTKNVSVVFRTRAQVDESRLTRLIEELQPRYNMTIDHTIRVQNLAASLVRYGKKEFTHETDGDIREIVAWLQGIPNPTFGLLATKLYEFDRKLDLVFQEGYLENF
jgi:hypothetical protein